MYLLGAYKLGYHINAILVGSQALGDYYDVEMRVYNRSGGLKKGYFFGMNNVPIKSIKFEENKHYLGAGDIVFNFVDSPLDVDDKVEIYYKGTKKWQAIIDNQVTKEGKIELVPYSEQLEDRIINTSYTGEIMDYMFEDILTNSSSIDVYWDNSVINTGDLGAYNWEFQYKQAKSAIDDLMKKLNGREWAVDLSNRFVIYEKSTSITKIIQNINNNWFTELKRKIDTKRIKATRHVVTQKSTDNKIEYVDEVGYDLPGNTYATLDIEKVRRRKDTRFDISFHSTDTTFLKDYAYSDLQAQALLGESITLKDFRIDKYDPAINTYIKVIDATEKQLKTLVNCDSITNWSAGTLYTDDYIEGSGCVQIIGSNPTDSETYYDLGEIKRFKKLEKINFMVKSDEDVGEVLQFGLSENSSTLWDNPYSVFINDTDIWELKEIMPDESSFRYVGFRLKNSRDTKRQFNLLGRNMLGSYAQPSLYTEFLIDRIQTFAFNYNEYEGLVVQKKYKIDNKGLTCDITLSDYDNQANQRFFDLNKEVENLKGTLQT